MKNIKKLKEEINQIREEVQQGIIEIMSNNNIKKTVVSTTRESYMLNMAAGANGNVGIMVDDGMDIINFKNFDVAEGLAIYEALAEKYHVDVLL